MKLSFRSKKLLTGTLLVLIGSTSSFASPCNLDDVFVSKGCYSTALDKASLPSDTPVPKAPHSVDDATLACLAKTSPQCAKCSRDYIVDKYDYNMIKSEKAIRENCLTLW